jgi:hypothetical protein
LTGSGFYLFYRASLIPVYSAKLAFFVSCEKNRALLRLLLSWRQYWRSKDYDFEIYSSLVDSTDPGWSGSFMVIDRYTGRQVVVTTNETLDDNHNTIVYKGDELPKDLKTAISKSIWASE